MTLAAEGCALHVAARKLAHSVRQTSSAFAYGTNEITFLPHTKKATVQTRRVLHSPSKGGKGRDRRGRGKRESREENRREREGREMPPFVPVLSFSLPSLSRRLSSLGLPQRAAGPGHDSLAPLAYSPGKASSAFAYRADERAVHDF